MDTSHVLFIITLSDFLIKIRIIRQCSVLSSLNHHYGTENFQSILAYLASYSVILHFWRDSLLFDKTIVNSLRYNARVRPGIALRSRLESYLRNASRNGISKLIPKGAHSIRVSNVLKIGGGFWNDVFSISLTYMDGTSPNSVILS